jgi:putative SOS response-associated peptidase YedK
MCYDIKASLEVQIKRTKRRGDLTAVEKIKEHLIPITDLPLHRASGFIHPQLLLYTDRQPEFPEVATWGLVPHWINDEEQLKKIWNNTLNARGETIFEKRSFRDSAQHKRCIVYVDGYYEHHHYKKKTFPFYIYRKDDKPLALAGLYSEWINPKTNGKVNTFTIVTTEGNELLSKTHNNPKLKGPRMPLILSDNLEDDWLNPKRNEIDVQSLIKIYLQDQLVYHSVNKLRGKGYLGNVEGISNKVFYEELEF